MGASSPVLGSRVRRFSPQGLRTTSSAPGYRWGNQRSLPKVATANVSVPVGASAGLDACPGAVAVAHRNAAVTINVMIKGRSLIAFLHMPEGDALRLPGVPTSYSKSPR